MTDVVNIARKCQADLSAEIARLDEFIHMAEKLLKYERAASNKAPNADRDIVDEFPINASTPAGANGAGAKA